MTSLQQIMNNHCWTEGREAHRAGVSLKDCPYDERDWVEMAAWEDGWLQGSLEDWLTADVDPYPDDLPVHDIRPEFDATVERLMKDHDLLWKELASK